MTTAWERFMGWAKPHLIKNLGIWQDNASAPCYWEIYSDAICAIEGRDPPSALEKAALFGARDKRA